LAVADTDALRERGLMGVTDVPPNEGMIFVFPDASNRARDFWMKDTVVPLDMVFVSSAGMVTEVDANVPASKPGAPDSTIAHRDGLGSFVIELRSGGARAAGLDPGERVGIPRIVSQ
jgi:uncharacterized membrane protein (UPF0127 family)